MAAMKALNAFPHWKLQAVAREVENAHRIGRPCLIGTTNVRSPGIEVWGRRWRSPEDWMIVVWGIGQN